MALKVFLDESGNTGPNYLDEDQPFYVLGGWIIDSSVQGDFEQAIVAWEKKLNRPSIGEIKSNRLLKSPKGLRQIFELISVFNQFNAIPVYCIHEKKYGICMLVTECLIQSGPLKDEVTNDLRIHIANTLYEILPDTMIKRFGRSSMDKNMPLFLELIREMIPLLASTPGAETAYQMARISNAGSAAFFLFSGDSNINSANLSVFHSILNMLECFSEDSGHNEWELFHDNTQQFEDDLKIVFEAINQNEYQRIEAENGFTYRFGQYTLSGISFLDSVKSPAVRASDYYVGSLNYLLKNIIKPENDQILLTKEIYGYFLEPFLAVDPSHPKLYPNLYYPTLSVSLMSKILLKLKT